MVNEKLLESIKDVLAFVSEQIQITDYYNGDKDKFNDAINDICCKYGENRDEMSSYELSYFVEYNYDEINSRYYELVEFGEKEIKKLTIVEDYLIEVSNDLINNLKV